MCLQSPQSAQLGLFIKLISGWLGCGSKLDPLIRLGEGQASKKVQSLGKGVAVTWGDQIQDDSEQEVKLGAWLVGQE